MTLEYEYLVYKAITFKFKGLKEAKQAELKITNNSIRILSHLKLYHQLGLEGSL